MQGEAFAGLFQSRRPQGGRRGQTRAISQVTGRRAKMDIGMTAHFARSKSLQVKRSTLLPSSLGGT